MKLKFEMSKLIPLPQIFEGENYERLKRSILAIMLGQKDDVFAASHDPDGNAWTPLSKKAERRKQKKSEKLAKSRKNTSWQDHKILVDTGALQNSLTIEKAQGSLSGTEGDEVYIGTNLPYAAIHQFGGTIEKKSIKSNISNEQSVSSIVIPARPFLGFGKNDEEEVREKIEAFVAKQGKTG